MAFKLLGNVAVDTDAEIYAGGEGGGFREMFDPDSSAFAAGLVVMVLVLAAIHLGVGKGHSL